MSDFTASTKIHATPAHVFAIVTDTQRMPEYMPTLEYAEMTGENKIRLKGNAAGHAYDREGWIKGDPSTHSMSWGAQGDSDYEGSLRIDGAEAGSEVTVNLSFRPSADSSSEFNNLAENRDPEIKRGLEETLAKIKALCEADSSPWPQEAGSEISRASMR
jgi:uncharacterized membrane protein